MWSLLFIERCVFCYMQRNLEIVLFFLNCELFFERILTKLQFSIGFKVCFWRGEKQLICNYFLIREGVTTND